jgi:hypothetical protein
VVATHQRESQSDHGRSVLTWYLPLSAGDVRQERERALSATHRDWVTLVLADLERAHVDLREVIRRVDVMRWGHAMVRPRPGFLWGGARARAQEPVGNRLHFAHTDLGGMALFEEACWFGVRAAEAVLSSLGRASVSWL